MDDLQQIAFPTLSQDHLAQLSRSWRRKTFQDGAFIWRGRHEKYQLLRGDPRRH